MEPRQGPVLRDNAPDEIDIFAWVMLVWSRRLWVIFATALFTVAGIAYALLATPIYHAETVIALNESRGSGDASRMFSQLGGVSGAVAAQLVGTNANLDKIEIILKGHQLAEQVVVKHSLLPVLFEDKWDSAKGSWKNPRKAPTVRDGGDYLRGKLLSVTPELKKNMLRLGIDFHDPVMTKRMVDYYLEALNLRIRGEVIEDADSNRAYLERQLSSIFDPILQEKLRSMIAYEVEKAMLVTSKSFDVLEEARVPLVKVSPKRGRIVILSFLGGIFISIGVILALSLYGLMRAKLSRYSA